MTASPTADLQSRCDLLRSLQRPGAPLLLPNAWDVATARAVVAAGFPVVATTSGGVAAMPGYEDHEGAPADEMLAAAARIARGVEVPVTVDADAGYGMQPGGRRTATAWRNASSGSPPKLASTCRQMFAWKMSPRLMYPPPSVLDQVWLWKHAVRPQERLMTASTHQHRSAGLSVRQEGEVSARLAQRYVTSRKPSSPEGAQYPWRTP